jgi:alpha-beta hydrolase superfamily lysophospholipase
MKMPVPYTILSPSFTQPLNESLKVEAAQIRAGYLPHQGTFKGNVLYFQGLGDSMLNHDPLFKKIARAGYRVIAFDYMGQGGSSGSMNKTRIQFIPYMGERVWNKFALETHRFPNKTIIGWSTGGLAAYLAASENRVDKVILIAPGIAPRKFVGEGIFNRIPNEITLETLTTDVYYDPASDPHRDEIKPNSPLKVPSFAINLLGTAAKVKAKNVSPRIKGFVLLSGKDDTYVNAQKARKIICQNASHFKIKAYEGALHEIDNERKKIREVAHKDILRFLQHSGQASSDFLDLKETLSCEATEI